MGKLRRQNYLFEVIQVDNGRTGNKLCHSASLCIINAPPVQSWKGSWQWAFGEGAYIAGAEISPSLIIRPLRIRKAKFHPNVQSLLKSTGALYLSISKVFFPMMSEYQQNYITLEQSLRMIPYYFFLLPLKTTIDCFIFITFSLIDDSTGSNLLFMVENEGNFY